MSKRNASSEKPQADGLKLKAPQVSYEQTLRRLEKIQGHLKRPRGNRMKGKVCIVTGVGSLKGIGRATTLLFAHEGAAALYLLDFDGTNLPDLKDTVVKSYPDVHVTTVQGDAADDSTISQLVEQVVKEQGRLDVFFANAGIASGSPSVLALSDTEWDRMMHVNTTSCFLAIKYGAPAMMKQKAGEKDDSNGSIILTASVAGLRSGAGPVHYSASKAAVNSMAQASSWNLSRTNVRVNSICPGLIETGMTVQMFDLARQRGTAERIGQLNPMGRYGVAEGTRSIRLASSAVPRRRNLVRVPSRYHCH